MANINSMPPELLEKILIELPPSSLRRSKRVCKTFCDAISSSVALKRKIWITDEPTVEPSKEDTPPSAVEINPFLLKIQCFDLFFEPDIYDDELYRTRPYHLSLETIRYGADQPLTLLIELRRHCCRNTRDAHEDEQELRKVHRRRHRLWSLGSQSAMQLVKPAIPITLVVNNGSGSHYLSLPAGVTMGIVQKLLRQIEEDGMWEWWFRRRARKLERGRA